MITLLRVDFLADKLKKLEKNINKGSSGTLTVVAGSKFYRGAADLSVGAALRTGCGIVRLVSIEKVVSLVAVRHPSCVFLPTDETDEGMISATVNADIAAVSKKSTAFLVGPGLGISTSTAAVVSAVADFSDKTVIDADAINIISQNKELLNTFKKPFVITPHIGEMSRLTGLSIEEIKKDRAGVAKRFSLENNCVTVLKDDVVYISSEKGKIYESRLGNEGLAKGGSGDVLSGFIAGFMANGYSAEDSAIIGAVLHGLSAEKCAAEKGKRAMLPSELEEYAVRVLKKSDDKKIYND